MITVAQTEAPLALLYNMVSVNENHHATVTFKMLAEASTNMLGGLSLEQKVRSASAGRVAVLFPH